MRDKRCFLQYVSGLFIRDICQTKEIWQAGEERGKERLKRQKKKKEYILWK